MCSFFLLVIHSFAPILIPRFFWTRNLLIPICDFFLLKPNVQILKLSFLRQFFWYQHWDPKWIGKSLETEMSHSVLIKSSELTAEQPSEDLVSVLEQRNKKNQRQRHHVLIKSSELTAEQPSEASSIQDSWHWVTATSGILNIWKMVLCMRGFCCYCWSCINLCCKWHFVTHNGSFSLTIEYKNAISYHSYDLKSTIRHGGSNAL